MKDMQPEYVGRSECDDCGAAGSDPPKLWQIGDRRLCKACLRKVGHEPPMPKAGHGDELDPEDFAALARLVLNPPPPIPKLIETMRRRR